MEAIDDYANENIVRSLAYTVLEERQAHNYAGLLSVASKLLRARMTVLGSSKASNQDWDSVVQWQQDKCPSMIESLWAKGGSVADEIYQKPVYYKRFDADTLHAMIEFAELDTHHFVVILILEEGSGEVSDIKYHNTKELTEEEWLDVFENWSRTMEDAERIFLTKVTRHKRIFTTGDQTPGTPDSVRGKEAPDDYWGDWSSDEGSSRDQKDQTRPHPLRDDLKGSEDEEEEYYNRWSKDPGTLTPGPEDERPARVLQPVSALRDQDELDEEYDQSYNPLFTVPSVPNLMDAHTAALSELTHMLQNSLPGGQSLRNNRVQPINPLPKAVSRLRANNINTQQPSSSSQLIEEPSNNEKNLIPGAYPESGTQSPVRKLSTTEEQVIGRGLFMKSLSALIGAARLLGYEGKDILEMVQEIVNNP